MSEKCSRNSEATTPDLRNFNGGWEFFRLAVKRMDEQRITAREKVREAMKAGGLPVPAGIVAELAQLRPADVRDVLLDHRGFTTWKRYGSYQISLRVFERAVQDLIKAIECFEAAAEEDILSRRQQDKLDDIERAIQKELFAAANAAHSLVDHSTRRLQPLVNIPGYPTKRKECFGDDGLHEFVIGLRTVLHHLHMIQAGWRLENHFGKGEKAMFTLNRDQVRFTVEQSSDSFGKDALARIRAYLHASSEPIDLKTLFEEYQGRAAKFHAWYGEALASDSLIALRDCERCLQESKNFGACTSWKALLGNWLNWKEPPNPYDHLHRYLTAEQTAEVYRLPMQSEEQVDKVIEFVDTDHACDVGLRKMAYQLFRCAKPPAPPKATA